MLSRKAMKFLKGLHGLSPEGQYGANILVRQSEQQRSRIIFRAMLQHVNRLADEEQAMREGDLWRK